MHLHVVTTSQTSKDAQQALKFKSPTQIHTIFEFKKNLLNDWIKIKEKNEENFRDCNPFHLINNIICSHFSYLLFILQTWNLRFTIMTCISLGLWWLPLMFWEHPLNHHFQNLWLPMFISLWFLTKAAQNYLYKWTCACIRFSQFPYIFTSSGSD